MDMDESQKQCGTKKAKCTLYIYCLYQVTNKQSYLCYFVILFRKGYICGKLVNYKETQKND